MRFKFLIDPPSHPDDVDVDVSEFSGPAICRAKTRPIPAQHMQAIAELAELGFAPAAIVRKEKLK